MSRDMENNVKVSRRATPSPCLSFRGNTETGTCLDSGWNRDFECLFILNPSITPTFLAGIADHLPSTETRAAGLHHGEEPLLISRLPASTTITAGLGGSSLLCTCSRAVGTLFQSGNHERLGFTERGFFKRNLQVVPKVGSSLDVVPATRTTSASKTTESSEHATKEVFEIYE